MTREETIERLDLCQNVCNDCLTCASHDEALDMAIAALREQDSNANQHVSNTSNALGGWNSVEERLPEPDTDVLTRRSTGMGVECYHKEAGGYWSWDEYSGKWRVTHWMPLPEPPEVEI